MISKEEISRLARLCHFELSEEEADGFALQIESVIRYFDQLDKVALENAEKPAASRQYSELRADEPQGFAADPFNTQYRKDGFIKGPRMA